MAHRALMTLYYADDTVSLYLGDCREILPGLDLRPDCVVADPPYGETALAWDRWPDGWPAAVADVASSMWCFGSMRMFLARRDEFTDDWRLSQDVVWQKQNGTSIAADRFRRIHECILHWYRGPWSAVRHEVPRQPYIAARPDHGIHRQGQPAHLGATRGHVWVDNGTRLLRSVLSVRSMWRNGGIHPTEKPIGILDPLIRYACPPSGLVLDPFAGSGSTAIAARAAGRRAVLIEADEQYCERSALRLSADAAALR
jgi:site-specific DNA-methyltransferase (adenine-specific)